MADNDRNRGYRDNDYRRPRPQTQQPSGDPLAELARLIGQQNESAPSYRQNGARTPYGGQSDADQNWARPDPFAQRDSYRPDTGAAQWEQSYSDSLSPGASGHTPYDSPYDQAAPQTDRSHYDQSHYDPGHFAGSNQSHGDPRHADPHHSRQSYPDARYGDPRYDDPQYSDQGYTDPRYDDPRYADPRDADPRYADPRYDDGAAQGYDEARYGDPNFGSSQSQYAQPSFAAVSHGYPQSGGDQGYPAYAYQGSGQPYGDSHYMPAPAVSASDGQMPARKRGSIVTVLAVLALAVVGTAAAFGYRAMFGSGGTPVPPPVIKADTRPSKVVPATDPNAKPIQDRVGVKTERIVPREEEPVQQAAPGQPRVIAPFLAGQNPQAFPPATASAAPPADAIAQKLNAPQASNSRLAAEPKRIRTVPIKPEQSSEAPAPRNTRSAAAAPAAQTDSDAPSGGSAPLALSPAAPPQRHAARQPVPAVTSSTSGGGAPFPTPIPSSTGSHVAAGAYAVQVTSQRSEADAQASFRSLQQQFPSVLGNRQPVIRRADLGEKGTYYRAQIPFPSQNEASEFCSSLKAAGGQCVVQRN